jgi:two-component system chemotaxis response regulator CheB
MASPNQNRDIVVVGASAGGIEALTSLIGALPTNLRATVLVAQHLQPFFPSQLPELLSSRTGWPAAYGVHGAALVPGHVIVAPPDTHLTLGTGHVRVVRGPRENGQRPAVDALFRSAARAYGPRVIGVVLTGYLDCGTAGLLSIKARGGLALVQDPLEAHVPDMPRSAIAHAPVDHVATLKELASLITRAVDEPAAAEPRPPSTGVLQIEGEIPGGASDIVCPSCQGRLSEATEGSFTGFRCHVGHAFGFQGLVAEQAEEVERVLWAAVRALEEAGTVARRAAAIAPASIRPRLLEKADTQFLYADRIRQILLSPQLLERMDAHP